jgi:hypothetical protein
VAEQKRTGFKPRAPLRDRPLLSKPKITRKKSEKAPALPPPPTPPPKEPETPHSIAISEQHQEPMVEDRVRITALMEELDPEYREFLENKKSKQAEEAELDNLLKPDPIMELTNVLGYSGGDLVWNKSAVYYTSSTALIGLDMISESKAIYSGHTEEIEAFALGKEIFASGQRNGLVHFWRYGALYPIHTFRMSHLKKLNCLSINITGQFLAASGIDAQSRDALVVYDIANVTRNVKPTVFAKQISGF